MKNLSLIFILFMFGCVSNNHNESKNLTTKNEIKIIENKEVKLSDIKSACELMDEFSKTYELIHSYRKTDSLLYYYIFTDFPMSHAPENIVDEINQKKAISFFKSKIVKDKVKKINSLFNRLVILQNLGAKKFITAEFQECNNNKVYKLYTGYYNYNLGVTEDILLNNY